jgi:methylglutaconyl-CoA hydratase
MIEALTTALITLGRDTAVRVVVLAGEGPVFSAGADLEYMRSMSGFGAEENVADARRLSSLFTSIRECPKPVLVRVQGAAVGGGAGLVAAGDLAIAEQGARFGFSEARLGLIPAVIAPYVISRIGAAATRELFLTGEIFGAERALELGLVNGVVAADDLDATVQEKVEGLLKSGPDAIAAVKRLIPYVEKHSFDSRDQLAEILADVRSSAEAAEGIAAFLERRPPSWADGDERTTGK